jgi:hypothetical protein
MRKSKFTEEQIIAVLAEQERGMATADLCRRHGVSSATHLSSGDFNDVEFEQTAL